MASPRSAVVLSDVTFAWPDGTVALDGLSGALSAGRTGLIGANGAGKSTLLRLVAGELLPTSGTVDTVGSVGHLAQDITLPTGALVADLLGVHDQLAALHAIESGDADPVHFDIVGHDWDVAARCRIELDRLGLTRIDVARHVGTLSGGETVLAALAGLRLRRCDIVLLDEPTNNLDRASRHLLYDSIAGWQGTIVVASHDVELLNLLDQTAELKRGSLTLYGGNYDAHQAFQSVAQSAAEQALRTAENELARVRRQAAATQTRLARRERFARNVARNKRAPKIVMNARKSDAQVSSGKVRGTLDARIEAAKDAVARQAFGVRRDHRIVVALPDPDVAADKRLAELQCGDGPTIGVFGRARVALTGRNGSGKTRLVEALMASKSQPAAGWQRTRLYTERVGYVPQRMRQPDGHETLLGHLQRAAPQATEQQLRANLARFLFRGDSVALRVADLSGGERFRIALASELLREPPIQLLVLDEPTNNLDRESVTELVNALADYRGGLIIVSHDDHVLTRLGVDMWLTLRPDGLWSTDQTT